MFLPADVTRAEPGAGVIPNALVDDEIGAAVRAIRERRADVWLVLDICNSGSRLHAASPDVATRFVDPAVLGVTVDAASAAEGAVLEETGPEPEGGFLAFYAAQSSEVAREVNIAQQRGTGAWYGLFTSKLAARLDGGAAPSYRQLFQAVLDDINDASVPGAARLQTPMWEGTLIDAAVFGGAETAGLRRFAVTGDEVAAGRVHGFGEGTLLGLFADSAAPHGAIIGHAQMETQAFLRPVAADCVPRTDAPCRVAGRLPEAARFARVVARPVDLVVRLLPPRDARTGLPLPENAAPSRALVTALAGLQGRAGPALALDGAEFDVDVLWDGAALWFGPTAVIGASPVGLAWTPGTPLAPLLRRIGRAETLARMLGSVAGAKSLLNPNPVALSADLTAVPVAALAAPGAAVSPVRECRMALSRADGANPLPPSADLKQCDQVAIVARGTVAGAFDVNRVHIDARFCVHAAWERIEDGRAARAVGPTMTLCSDCPGGYSAGRERLFTVVTEARPNAEALNLEGLVETCGGASATRGTAAD